MRQNALHARKYEELGHDIEALQAHVVPDFVDALGAEPALARYYWLPSVRGDLLFKLGTMSEARTEFEGAAAMTRNAREQELLLGRADDCRNA